MIITDLQPPDLRARATQYVERTEGCHVSRVIHDLLCALDPERYEDREGGPNWANFYMGLIYERALEMAWLDKEIEGGHRPGLIRPGEVTRDGMIGTPDAYDTAVWYCNEEYKMTKKSCRQSPTDPKFWHYWVQLKAYAYMTGCTGGNLWVCFVNGDYSYRTKQPTADSGYVIKGWHADFSQTELLENWAMILNHARRKGWV